MTRSDPKSSDRLPARHLGDAKLSEAVERGGCPICTQRADAEASLLESLVYEFVNDGGFRAELERDRGFCRIHSGALAATERSKSGGTLGAAILYGAILGWRLPELPDPGTGGRSAEHALDTAARLPDCPVCRAGREAAARTIEGLLGQLDDDRWADAVARAELCLDDLVALWSRAVEAQTKRWSDVANAQLARLRQLDRLLEGFAHNSSYDRRGQMTDEERDASRRAEALFAGNPTNR